MASLLFDEKDRITTEHMNYIVLALTAVSSHATALQKVVTVISNQRLFSRVPVQSFLCSHMYISNPIYLG